MKVKEFIKKCIMLRIMLPIVVTRGTVYYLTPLSDTALEHLKAREDDCSHCFNDYVDLSKTTIPDINKQIGDFDIELISAIKLNDLEEPIIELHAG